MVHDVLTVTSASEECSEIRPDPLLEYRGWQKYADEAQLNLDAYNAHIRVSLSPICKVAEMFSLIYFLGILGC